MSTHCRAYLVVTAVLLAAVLTAGAHAAAAPSAKCRKDLAKRLDVKASDIEVVSEKEVTWPDGSLGLPQPGQMYTMALVPGWVIVLDTPSGPYVYTASESAVKYAGPASLWAWSALYIEPIPNEPNLNGNLVEVSLLGSHPRVLIAGVSSYWPQGESGVLAKRRTSRSGHELVYMPAGGDEATRLAASFDFGAAATNADGSEWAAISRPMIRTGWEVMGGRTDGGEPSWDIGLPEGVAPWKLNWSGEHLLVQGEEVAYELDVDGDNRSWREVEPYLPVDAPDLMLNKSETVAYHVTENGDDAGTKIVRRWFTGDETEIATIPGFICDTIQLSPDTGYLLVSGREGETRCAFTVCIASGEVIPTVSEMATVASLGLTPPANAKILLQALKSALTGE